MNVPNKHYQDWYVSYVSIAPTMCASATNFNFFGDAMMQPKNKNFYVNAYLMCVKRNRLNFNIYNEKM